MSPFDASRSQDKTVILKRVPVFSGCTDEQLQLIAERTRLVEYKKGECVYREGDTADAFYIVSSGRLRGFSVISGRERTFTVFHNGDSFGEISLLSGETHSATVQALNDTLVLVLEKKDFDEVINRIPSLVLYLSRLLSKRLRARERGGEFAEATIIALYGVVSGVGRTSLAAALAVMLKRETGQSVVIIDFSRREGDAGWLYGSPATESPPSESVVEPAFEAPFGVTVSEHTLGFNVVNASELRSSDSVEQAIAPLLNFLSNKFHYVLIDLPVDVDPAVLKALTQSDLIYLMTDRQKDHTIQTKALIHQLQPLVGALEQRLRLVLTLLDAPGELLSSQEISQQVGVPVAFTLPQLVPASGQMSVEEVARVLENSADPFTRTVRRCARELGGLLVGLVLGSGAALGLAHIGVLKVLEREKIPIDLIVGTSIGAYIGGLWASGHSVDELEQLALSFKDPWEIRRLFVLDIGIPAMSILIGILVGVVVSGLAGFWTGLLFGFILTVGIGVVLGPLSGGPIQGARLSEKLQKEFAGKTFEDTWPPLKIIAANPMAREEVVFESGPIDSAVRASVSIPGIFKPVIRDGKVCLDGGVINPVPVSVAKRAGANRIIAVNVFPTTTELAAHLEEVERRRAEHDAQIASRKLAVRLLERIRQELVRSISPLVFDVIMRSMQAMEHQIAEIGCRDADLILRPTVPGSYWLEFFRPEKFIQRGEEVALEHLPELKRITRARVIDNA